MALKAKVKADVWATLPADVKKEYTQDGEDYVLSVESVDGLVLENVQSIKNTLQKERTANEKLKNDLKAFKDLDPEAARAALEKVKEFGDMTPEQKAQELLAAKEKQIEAKWKKQVDQITADGKLTEGQLEDLLVTQAATKALADNKGSIDLLLPHVKGQVKLRKLENGKRVAEVVDGEGNARVSTKPGNTSAMTIEELVLEMKASEGFSRGFDASGQSGGGTTTTNKGGPNTQRTAPIRTVTAAEVARGQSGASLEDIASGKVAVTGV